MPALCATDQTETMYPQADRSKDVGPEKVASPIVFPGHKGQAASEGVDTLFEAINAAQDIGRYEPY